MKENIERKIIINLITNDEYLSKISNDFKAEYLVAKMSKKIGQWCVDYYKKYQKAPGKEIEDFVYEQKEVLEDSDEEYADLVNLMTGLSRESSTKVNNTEYLIDESYKYFQLNHAYNFREELDKAVTKGDTNKITELFTGFNYVTKPAEVGATPVSEEAMINDMTSGLTPMFNRGGVYGSMVDIETYKESFICFLAPTKRGKTWFLMDMCINAQKAGMNVVFISTGDMSEAQFNDRYYHMLSGKAKNGYFDGVHYRPVLDCTKNQDGTCQSDFRACKTCFLPSGMKMPEKKEEIVALIERNTRYSPCTFCRNSCIYERRREYNPTLFYEKVEGDTPRDIEDYKRIYNRYSGDFAKRLKYVSKSTVSFSVDDLNALLNNWEKKDGFIADVIIIDYADIMRPSKRHATKKEDMSDIYLGLRKLSQDRRVCLISAMQATKEAQTTVTIDSTHIADDRCKGDHVTCLLGLCQTPAEKGKGLMRVNKIYSRAFEFDPEFTINVTQDLRTGKPVLDSY